MAAEGRQEVARGAVHQPQHVVFASTEDGVSLRVPLHEVDVVSVGRAVGQFALLDQLVALRHRVLVLLHLPYAENVVEATSDAKLPIKVELDVFDGLCMTFKLHDLDALVFDIICASCRVLFRFFLFLDFVDLLGLDGPDEALVLSVAAQECIERRLWQEGETVDVVLMDTRELAHKVLLYLRFFNYLAFIEHHLLIVIDV